MKIKRKNTARGNIKSNNLNRGNIKITAHTIWADSAVEWIYTSAQREYWYCTWNYDNTSIIWSMTLTHAKAEGIYKERDASHSFVTCSLSVLYKEFTSESYKKKKNSFPGIFHIFSGMFQRKSIIFLSYLSPFRDSRRLFTKVFPGYCFFFFYYLLEVSFLQFYLVCSQ